MRSMAESSIDTIITDPPYGLSFMGKKWDYDVPSVETWKACLRVLKPGGTALIFAGSRTQHRMAVNVEDAGFILKDCIMWLYGSGFPKATDISKQLDKGHKREVVGVKKSPDGRDYSIENAVNKGEFGGENAFKKSGMNKDKLILTASTTPEAILWNGWKSHGLKPAYEPILVCMKPNEGTYANNALVYGVSGLNIDGGRIEAEPELAKNWDRKAPCGFRDGGHTLYGKGELKDNIEQYKPEGRFPANVILDEEAGVMLDEQSSTSTTGNRKNKNRIQQEAVSTPFTRGQQAPEYTDKGGASRFFYCAKASKKERNAGCENINNQKFTAGNYSQSPVCKACDKTLNGTNDHSKCSDEVYYREMESKNTSNHHPTVKPLALMEYLCTLTKTPTGGIVLDPFMGSGTTGIACRNTGRDFVGIEKESEYCEIAKARITAVER